MTSPYRALCAELLAALKSWSPHGGGPLECWEDREEEADLIARAETELAQPEPEEPTDEEIMELMPQQMRYDLAAAARALAGYDLAAAARALAGFDRANVKAAGAMRIILNRHAVDHVRAVLSHYCPQ
jgi:hypothetical protein